MLKEQLSLYTVLYAEDEKSLQATTATFLKKYFKHIYLADDGKEALEVYKKVQPDILFLDIDMPYIDGLEVAQEVRQSNENIPIVMLTAYTDTDKFLRATELNLCKYLVKPIKPLEFKSTLQKLSDYFQKQNASLIYLKDSYFWDTTSQKLSHNNQIVMLTQKEQSLLSLLISKQNCCVTFTDIQAFVWEDDFDIEISIQSVKLQVTLLRKKLPKDSIKNVYGKGYIFYN